MAFQSCARHKVAGKVASPTQTSSSSGALRVRNTVDGPNLLFQIPQSVPPSQQHRKNLLDVETKILLTDPIHDETFFYFRF